MFFNLIDEKWVETDNIVTFEPYYEMEDLERLGFGDYSGSLFSHYELGLIINGQKIKLYSSKKIRTIDSQEHIDRLVEMLRADRCRLWNIYYKILEIKTGKKYKKFMWEFSIKKGQRGKRRKIRCKETGEVFSSKEEAVFFLMKKTNYTHVMIESKLTDVINNRESSCYGFHFEEI